MNITDWIAHADLLYNQLFLIVMGGLYGLAIGIVSFLIVYMVFIFPNFKSWITYLHHLYTN
jgi:hypothetical protein